ncbi:MAG: phosphatase PAP2 family protein [Ginsengibacter sp.]
MENDFTEPISTQAAAIEKPSIAIKIPAQIFSYLFHPLFIPVIITWFLEFIVAGYFTGIPYGAKGFILIRVAYNTIFFPAFTIILLKALGFIDSIFLRTQRERIIPYIATNIYYFWMYLVFRNQPDVPLVLTAFIFGIFLCSSLALLANVYFKISMHAMGVGAFLGVMLLIIFSGTVYGVFLPAMLVILLTGFVCTSRLIVSNHTPFDVYAGILLGIVSQFIASAFIGG